MELKIEIRRLNELVRAFDKAPAKVKVELRRAIKEALVKIQKRARKEHRFRTRSGNLERSIEDEMISDWPPTGRVWLNPVASKTASGQSYGVFQHEGTREHFVRPRTRKALRWVNGGRIFFSKGHRVRGIQTDQFIYKAADNERAAINAIFDRRINAILNSV